MSSTLQWYMAVGGQQVGPVFRLQKRLQRIYAGNQPHQIIFAAQRIDRLDKVMRDALFLQMHFQAVSEET